MARSALTALALAGLLGALPLTAHGTTFIPMNEAALVHASAAVLIGTVTAIESAQTGPDGAIYTYIHVQPVRIIKGALSTEPIVLREPGGAVGNQRQVTFGAPEFWVGERALLFLSRNADGTFQTHSLAMGKFGIGTDRAGHATAVRDLGFGTSMLMPETGEVVEAARQSERLLPMLKRLKNIARAERRSGQAAEPPNAAPDQLSMPTQVQEAYTFIGSPPARW